MSHYVDDPLISCCFFSRFQALADAMTGISNSAKQGELDQFCDSVRNFANAVCGLTENSAQVRCSDVALLCLLCAVCLSSSAAAAFVMLFVNVSLKQGLLQ